MRSAVDQMETIGLVTQAEYVLRTRQVYVDVMLRPRPVTEAVADTGIGSVSSPEAGRRASLASFLAPGRVLAVLGAAGSGKTTLVRHTALEIVERRWPSWRRRRRLPVLLYLRDHGRAIAAGGPEGLARIAVTAPWLGGAVSAEWLEKQLTRGRCVVLLDGLDEVADSEDRSRVVQWVEDQISRYPANAFAVTSRPLGYDGNRLSRADVLQVQRFTGRQIRAFLHSWYRAIEHRSREGDPKEIDRLAAQAADDLFRRISNGPALFDLASNPLLLTMIANVHRYRGSLPGSRVALYEEVCQVLLHRRQEAKRLTDPEMDGLSGEKRERVVQELAWYMMRRELRDIPAEDAGRAIRTVLERTAPDITPAAFLLNVKRSGLLLEHQYGRYGFAHLTLQEYLASTLVPAHASRRQLLVDNVGNPWWREVTLLWVARADAGPIVEACLEDRTVTALSLAYACADEARELDPDLRSRLDLLLRTAPSDLGERRLLDGVVAARALHDTHVLDDGTRICAAPVPEDLWRRFVARTGAGPDSVSGDLWTRDIKDFLAWLNILFSDGTGYRLPTPAEARQVLDLDLYTRSPGSGTPVILYAADEDWADEYGQARLVPDSPAGFAHDPNVRQVSYYPARILQQTHVFFRLFPARAPSVFVSLLAFGRPRDLDKAGDRLIHALDLARDLGLARGVLFYPMRDRALKRAAELGFEDLPADADDLDGLRHRALAHALDLAQDLGLDMGPELRPASQGGGDDSAALFSALSALLPRHAPDIFHAYPLLARELAHPLPLDNLSGTIHALRLSLKDLDWASVIDLGRALTAADNFATVLKRVSRSHRFGHVAGRIKQGLIGLLPPSRYSPAALDSYSDLIGPEFDEVLSSAEHLREIASSTEPKPTVDLAHDLYYALQAARNHALALVEIRAVRTSRSGVPGQDLAHVLTLARLVFAGDLGRLGMNAAVGTASACLTLRRSFEAAASMEPARSRRNRSRTLSLEGFLHRELERVYATSPAHDPGMALEAALSRANTVGNQEVAELIGNATRLAASLWSQSRRARQSDMVLAVTSLLAAILRNKGAKEDYQLAHHLSSALSALTALTPESDVPPLTTPPSSKLLVLAQA
ncbi:NACHT domain-containing protein [Actinomadura sp. NPDC048032]|uniref:NACHT domain-containing protein n=1 Tax=Actinomadura sp. NPDC048032 TaxID=3155747 RepID=UPI003407AC9D